MEAPRCIVCNTKHWSRQPCPATGREAKLEHARALRQAEAVTENPQIPVTKIVHSVTENSPSVTINTPVTANPSPISVTLAKRKRGRPPTGKAQSAAERMRQY